MRISEDVSGDCWPGGGLYRNRKRHGRCCDRSFTWLSIANKLPRTAIRLLSCIAIWQKLSESGAPSMTLDGSKMNVSVVDKTNPVTADNLLDTEIEITNQQTGDTTTHKLREFAKVEQELPPTMIHVNSTRAITVTADVEDGYNNALLGAICRPSSRIISCPRGYTIQTSGELENINTMLLK